MAKEHIRTAGPALTAAHFNAPFWHLKQAITGTSGGRNTVWFVNPALLLNTPSQEQWVLRHYYRGGLPGKFVRKSFIFTGLEQTRAVAEFELLKTMQGLKLPVPKPIGAYVLNKGLTYQASILLVRIEGSQDLGRLLLKQKLTTNQWQQIGATIKRFHLAGVFHSDLNCKNILWRHSDSSTYLIDFDRCYIKPPNQLQKPSLVVFDKSWQGKNLARLQRSFVKQKQQAKAANSTFHFTTADWQALLLGYQQLK